MKNVKHFTISMVLAIGLSACNSNTKLRTQVSAAQDRLKLLEAEIAANTQEIGAPGQDIRTKIAYRPFKQWASDFGQRTITFRQTSKGGNLVRERRNCAPGPFGRKGIRVAIHEENSTRIDYTIGPLELTPGENGLVFSSAMLLEARTQIAGSARDKCWGGWEPTVTQGFSARSSPTVRLRLDVAPGEAGTNPFYKLAVISPNTLDVELRTGIRLPLGVDVDIRETVRVRNFAQQLAGGQLDLFLENSGKVVLPDGSTRNYTLATVEPTLDTDISGVSFGSDIELVRETASN